MPATSDATCRRTEVTEPRLIDASHISGKHSPPRPRVPRQTKGATGKGNESFVQEAMINASKPEYDEIGAPFNGQLLRPT